MAVLFLPVFLVIGFASRNKVLEEHAVIDDLYMEDKERTEETHFNTAKNGGKRQIWHYESGGKRHFEFKHLVENMKSLIFASKSKTMAECTRREK